VHSTQVILESKAQPKKRYDAYLSQKAALVAAVFVNFARKKLLSAQKTIMIPSMLHITCSQGRCECYNI